MADAVYYLEVRFPTGSFDLTGEPTELRSPLHAVHGFFTSEAKAERYAAALDSEQDRRDADRARKPGDAFVFDPPTPAPRPYHVVVPMFRNGADS